MKGQKYSAALLQLLFISLKAGHEKDPVSCIWILGIKYWYANSDFVRKTVITKSYKKGQLCWNYGTMALMLQVGIY